MSKFKAENPQEIEFTFSHKMKLKEWIALRKQLGTDNAGYVQWPASELSSAITDMVDQAERVFYPSSEER